MRALISFMKDFPLGPNFLTKAPPPNTMGFRIQHIYFGGGECKHSDNNSTMGVFLSKKVA